jgi:hypothetical protein
MLKGNAAEVGVRGTAQRPSLTARHITDAVETPDMKRGPAPKVVRAGANILNDTTGGNAVNTVNGVVAVQAGAVAMADSNPAVAVADAADLGASGSVPPPTSLTTTRVRRR